MGEKRKQEKYTLKMNVGSTQGLIDLLNTTEAKKRTELRSHGRIRREMEKFCIEKQPRTVKFPGDTQERIVEDEVCKKESVMTLTREQFEFLEEIAGKKIDAGVSGGMAKNYLDLLEAIEESGEADTKEEKKE